MYTYHPLKYENIICIHDASFGRFRFNNIVFHKSEPLFYLMFFLKCVFVFIIRNRKGSKMNMQDLIEFEAMKLYV